MEPSLLALARACLRNRGTITCDEIHRAVLALSPEVLAAIAEPGGQRPAEN